MRIMKKVIVSFIVVATITLSLAPLSKAADDNQQSPTISPFNIIDRREREK